MFVFLQVFDIENMKLIENFRADENAICTLAVGNGMLFSGSLKSIKVLFTVFIWFTTEEKGIKWPALICKGLVRLR